jgi:septal ring factor EnvC (AmiA/AmiB activator)
VTTTKVVSLSNKPKRRTIAQRVAALEWRNHSLYKWLKQIFPTLDENKKQLEDHEERLKKLEEKFK